MAAAAAAVMIIQSTISTVGPNDNDVGFAVRENGLVLFDVLLASLK